MQLIMSLFSKLLMWIMVYRMQQELLFTTSLSVSFIASINSHSNYAKTSRYLTSLCTRSLPISMPGTAVAFCIGHTRSIFMCAM